MLERPPSPAFSWRGAGTFHFVLMGLILLVSSSFQGVARGEDPPSGVASAATEVSDEMSGQDGVTGAGAAAHAGDVETSTRLLEEHPDKDKDEVEFFVVVAIVVFAVGVALLFHTVFMAGVCLMVRHLLNSLPEEHRQLEVRRVWWLLIPIFNLAWNFHVFPRLARSFGDCFRSQGSSDADGVLDLARGYCIVAVISVFDFGGMGVGRIVPILLLVLLMAPHRGRGCRPAG